MYSNWTPSDGQVQQAYSYYRDNQLHSEHTGYLCASASPPSNNYHASPAQSFPPQQSQQPRGQFSLTHDPRLTVQQTNQALTALALARGISPEYLMEASSLSTPTYGHSRQGSYYDAQPSHRNGYHSGQEGPSNPVYGSRPGQTPPIIAVSPPSTSTSHFKSSDGHACGYCGKAFGRPSALKIHLAIHTGERAFVCPETGCHRSFSVRSNMSRHVRNVHQIWPEENQDDLDPDDEWEDQRSG